MNNRLRGSRFESALADELYRNGWWVHLLQQNKAGQPADIIACKGRVTALIDAKECAKHSFPLSRVEENQENAMRLWNKRVNRHTYFAVRDPDNVVYMIPYLTLEKWMDQGVKEINELWVFMSLDKWLIEMERQC